eukprot:SAG22_NODE_273_length_13182_cov_12.693419_8_plen_651_part_00
MMQPLLLLSSAAAAAAAAAADEDAAPPPNMNGRVYPGIANSLPGHQHTGVHRGEYFDVAGDPVTMHYSEVFWTAQPAVPLPADVVARFKGRAISFTGFEVDIVRADPETGVETSVPSYEWYNHHYCATIRGAHAKMAYVGPQTHLHGVDRRAIEVHPPEWEPRSLPSDTEPNSTVPTAQNFWQGNGGEHRLSFKHFSKGYGQLVESPEEFILQPMLINTKNPGGGPGPGRGQPHEAAPLPKTAIMQFGPNATAWRDGAKYSGLMECPCTTRVKRVISGYETQSSGTGCGGGAAGSASAGSKPIGNSAECFAAAASLFSNIVANQTSDDAATPSGCFIVSHSKGGDAAYEAFWNGNAGSKAHCGAAGAGPVRSMGVEKAAVTVGLDLDGGSGNATITLTGPVGKWFGVGFGATIMANTPWTVVVDGAGAVTERKLANHMPGTVLPPSVTVVSSSVGPKPSETRQANHWGVPLATAVAADAANCSANCAAAVGCKAWTWAPRGDDGSLDARWRPYNMMAGLCTLRASVADATGAHSGFTDAGWLDGMRSGQVSAEQERTVVLRRPLKGRSPEYYSFDPTATAVPFIDAVGTTSGYQYHGKLRGGSSLMLVEAGAPVCVCRGAHTGGSINGLPWQDNCAQVCARSLCLSMNVV